MSPNGIAECIIPKGRYLTPDQVEDLAFKPEQIQEMTRYIKKQAYRW